MCWYLMCTIGPVYWRARLQPESGGPVRNMASVGGAAPAVPCPARHQRYTGGPASATTASAEGETCHYTAPGPAAGETPSPTHQRHVLPSFDVL